MNVEQKLHGNNLRSTTYQYDLMGNITGLTRSGLQDDNTPVYKNSNIGYCPS